MPEKKTTQRARRDRRQGKKASTQAGNYVAEEMRHKKSGKHPVKGRKQAIAIGLSKARRAGVKVPKKGASAKRSSSASKGSGTKRSTSARKPTAKRSTRKTTRRTGTSGKTGRKSTGRSRSSGSARRTKKSGSTRSKRSNRS